MQGPEADRAIGQVQKKMAALVTDADRRWHVYGPKAA